MNNFPVPPEHKNETSPAEDNIIVHPETGQKFDAMTGLPIEENNTSTPNSEEKISFPSPEPKNVLPQPKSSLPQPKALKHDEEALKESLSEPPVAAAELTKTEVHEIPLPQFPLPVKPSEPILEPENQKLNPSNDTPEEIEETKQDPNVEESNIESSNLKEQVRKSKWEAGGRPSQNKAKIPDIISVRDWDDNTEDDPIYGLGSDNDAEEKKNKPKTNQKLVLNERDYIMMSFMTRYRYCYSDQLARLVGAENKDVRARLTKLEKAGYVRREVVTRNQDLWLTRKAGLQIIGSPYNAIARGQVSTLYIQHTIGVGNLGVELEMGEGGKNILGEKDFPKINRYPYGMYDPEVEASVLGEMTVTEREIRSSNRVLRGGNQETTLDLKYKVEAAVADETAPERLEGNEWMFVVYGKGEHVPDLVVHRPRGEDGKPQHIAIELELTAKDLPGWRRILKWYQEYGIMYDKVYYFTHSRTIATRLQKVIDELGLSERVIVRKYIPNNNRGPFWG